MQAYYRHIIACNPPLDEALLARAPALRAVVHAAGTVKNHVTQACFERGLAISSAAAAATGARLHRGLALARGLDGVAQRHRDAVTGK